MQLLLLIAGLILLFAGPWFAGQATVAIILLVVFGLSVVIPLLFAAGAFAFVRRQHKRF